MNIDRSQLAIKIIAYTIATITAKKDEYNYLYSHLSKQFTVNDTMIDEIQTDVCSSNNFEIDLRCNNEINMFIREKIVNGILSEFGVGIFDK